MNTPKNSDKFIGFQTNKPWDGVRRSAMDFSGLRYAKEFEEAAERLAKRAKAETPAPEKSE